MGEDLVLTAPHWIFLLVLLSIFACILFRKDVILPCILGSFLIGVAFHAGEGIGTMIIGGFQVVFTSFLVAGTELLEIMVVISLMVAMLKALQDVGADVLMIQPMRKLMKTPTAAFFILGSTMYVAASFFWPTPAIALVGTVLIPVAVKVGLPAMGAAVTVNLFGHGMALSSDLVIQGATQLSSSASGVETTALLPLTALFSLVTGFVAVSTAFYMLKRDMKKGKLTTETIESKDEKEGMNEKQRARDEIAATTESPSFRTKFLAFLVPISLLIVIVTMVYRSFSPNYESIQGGSATALLGGTAVALLIVATFLNKGFHSIDRLASHIREGFFFAIKIFAPIIPIAGFFFMGSPEHSQTILGEEASGFLFDLGAIAAPYFAGNEILLTFGIVLVAILAGLDGSGFSGLPLVGSLAASLGGNAGLDVAVLASLGQVVTIFIGGGTLTAWAFGVVADAGIAGVKPVDLVRRNFIPVLLGIFVATCLAIFIM